MAPLKKLPEENYTIPTRLVHGPSHTEEWDYTHHVIPPVTASSSFRLDSAGRGAKGFEAIGKSSSLPTIYVYDRMGEPNNNMLQNVLATAEEGEAAVTFSTGMAAIHAAVCFSLQSGDEIISHKTIYGCTYTLFTYWLPRMGVKVHFCDLTNPDSFLPLVNNKTKLVYLESPSNPNLELLDVRAIANHLQAINQGRQNKILSIIDNTFCTPWCQRPIPLGVDIVVHSLTKGISGFGTDMGGAVITRKEYLDQLILFRKDFGGTLAPQTAWHILVYGISTLSLRVPRQQENAMKVAEFLSNHRQVEFVRYPGLQNFPQLDLAKRQMLDYSGNFAPGFMVYFCVKGDTPQQSKLKGEKIMDYLAQNSYTVTLAVSLGQLRTLVEHPGSMTHAGYPAEEQLKRGIDPGGIRLAVGIEDPADIIRDLDEALSHC